MIARLVRSVQARQAEDLKYSVPRLYPAYQVGASEQRVQGPG